MATLALCVICKNERDNLPRLLKSVEGCFDEIHITDTGSTDGTLEWLVGEEKQGRLKLHHFQWINDFGAARNYSFSHSTADYTMWLDCDDVLFGREEFISWKTTLMNTHNYWLATYHYGLDEKENPVCSFMRERVVKTDMGFEWAYFVHEGIKPVPKSGVVKTSYASTWSVKHLRSAEDLKADKSRNLNIFEVNKHRMDDRMAYYYGKELFENGQPLEAYNQLSQTAMSPNLEHHDRVLCLQYAAMAAGQLQQFEKVREMAYKGLNVDPQRAEFYVLIGDSFIKQNRLNDAAPSYFAATRCLNTAPQNSTFAQAMFTSQDAYTFYPRNQLARVYFQRNDIETAKRILEEAMLLGPNVETATLYAELDKVQTTLMPSKDRVVKNKEIVITCPQAAMYQWDENVAKSRGIGGSETAVVQMSRHLRNMTGNPVRIFMDRPEALEIDGVFYEPMNKMAPYFAVNEPRAHIAWRHNIKLTNAPTYLWSHDLACPGIDVTGNYTEVMALSEFHKNYIHHIFKVPRETIRVTRNGIDLKRFEGLDFSKKDPNKIVFSSSPDRGLDRAIRVVEAARQATKKSLELHCFYGFDNMEKLGLTNEVTRLRRMINERDWVKFHGNVQQDRLVTHLQDAKAWIYPTDFLETFCITALEMLACQVAPVVRAHGALPFTLSGLPAHIVDRDCVSDADVSHWAEALGVAIENEQPRVDMNPFAWESVAREWLTFLPKTE